MSEEDYTPDETAGQAFAQPDNHALGDSTIEPFTPERFVAAQSMGLLWPLPGETYRKDGGLYRGEANDATIVLWLCSIPSRASARDDWSVARAIRQWEAAHEEALRWATEKGILQADSPPFWQAMNVYERILVDLVKSYREPVEKGPTNPK